MNKAITSMQKRAAAQADDFISGDDDSTVSVPAVATTRAKPVQPALQSDAFTDQDKRARQLLPFQALLNEYHKALMLDIVTLYQEVGSDFERTLNSSRKVGSHLLGAALERELGHLKRQKEARAEREKQGKA